MAKRTSPKQQSAKQLFEALKDAENEITRIRYRIGCLALATKGTHNLRNLADVLGVQSLYRYANVAKLWDERAFERLLTRGSITWFHLVLLAAVKDRAARESLIRSIVDDGLSVRAFTAVLRRRGLVATQTATPAFRAVKRTSRKPENAAALAKALADAEREVIRVRYRIGCFVLEGGGARDLAEISGIHASSLYRYASVAKLWNARALEKLMQIRGPGVWYHLILLARVKDRSERESLTRKVIDEGLSVRALMPVLRRQGYGGYGPKKSTARSKGR